MTPSQEASAARGTVKMSLETTLLLEREEARKKAIDSLARYKFQMFGYWAAIWVHLNRALATRGLGCDNPFRSFVGEARKQRGD